ncbi:MAG: flagellar hook-length control protein FliK [bacterium]
MVYQALPPGAQNNIAKLLDLGLSRIAAGQPVSGQILADEGGGKATVLLGGRQFTLNLGTGQAAVGQSFTAQLSEGRLVIHLGSQQASVPVESLVGQSTPRPLAAVLSNLGAPTGPVAQAVAHAFLTSGMPLSAEAIKTLVMVLPQLSSGDVSALSFMFSRGLPISPEGLQIVQRTLDNRTRIGERLAEIDRGLGKVERQLDAMQDRVVAIQRRDELDDRRRNLRREFVQWAGDNSQEGKEKLAEELERSVKGQSTSAEAVQYAGASGAHLALSLYDLYLYLLQLQQMDILGSEIPFSLLMNQVNEAYEALAGQNLHNLPDEDPDRPPIFFFQIPIVLEGEERTLELLYRQHSHHPEDGGALTIRLELSQLGPIKIAFDMREGMLSVTITVTSAELKESIEPELDTLRQALSGIGLRVASVGVVHGVVPSTLREEAPQTAMPAKPPKGLDLMV